MIIGEFDKYTHNWKRRGRNESAQVEGARDNDEAASWLSMYMAVATNPL